MKKWQDYFSGKRVTVMGLGLLGRGVGDAAFLAEMGADVTVTDLKTATELSSSLAQLQQHENITYVLGEHRQEDFVDRDFILVAAGVPVQSPYLQVAREHNVPLKQSAAWFAELSDIPIIGVTGTRGKSTVTHMIHHVLATVTGEEVLLGGNIRGVSNLQLLKDVKEDSLCVMELDSWQLQGWGWAGMSPQVAVFTNFMEDHQNYYLPPAGGDAEAAMDLYFADKAQIFLHQDEAGVLITTPEVFACAKSARHGIALGGEVVLADASVIPDDAHLAMPGEHNRQNAALAVQALRALSLTEEDIFPALSTFPGVEGRLQYVGEVGGARVYNDNNATTPAATVRALQAVGDTQQQKVVLIAGGADKGLGIDELVAAVGRYCHTVVLLPGTGTDMLAPHVPGAVQVADVAAALAAATSAATAGDVILFSPGFASFGLFKNEYERNDAFMQLVTQQLLS